MIEETSLVDKALKRIKFAYEVAQMKGLGELYVCFSGGKDSCVLEYLVRKAKELYGVQYTLNYNMTGIDHPELVYFMRNNYPDLIWHKYKKSMWRLIVEKHIPPTRIFRYCCAELKERGGEGKMCLTGVRWAESIRRKKRRKPYENLTNNIKDKMLFNDNDEGRLGFETCVPKRKHICNAIIDWDDRQLWDFIIENNITVCKLYYEGYKRLGCIGCPMSSKQDEELERNPKFKAIYIKTFDRMLQSEFYKDGKYFKTGQEVYDWWIRGKKARNKDQISFEELLKDWEH